VDIEIFAHKIENLYQRVSNIYLQANEPVEVQTGMLPVVFKELGTASEELQVAIEEMRQQSEELLSTQLALELERQRYQELFEEAPDAYLVTDGAGVILEANRAASKLLNLSHSYLIGKPLSLFIIEEERRNFRSELSQIHQYERVPEWSIMLQPRKGEPFDAAMTLSTVRNVEGKAAIMRWLLRDVTERKQSQKVLENNDYDPSKELPRHFFTKGENISLSRQSIWLVCQGVVKLSTVCENGEEVIVGLAGPQMPFGSSFTSLQIYQATALSSNVQLVSISLSEIANSPSLAKNLLPKINRRLQQTEAFLALAGHRRVKDRLYHLLLLLQQEIGQVVPNGTRLSVRLTHNDLANACCTTRVTMTRLLSKIQQEGKISFDSKSHIILKPEFFENDYSEDAIA